MKKIKRIISVLLIISMVWTSNAMCVFAEGVTNAASSTVNEKNNSDDKEFISDEKNILNVEENKNEKTDEKSSDAANEKANEEDESTSAVKETTVEESSSKETEKSEITTEQNTTSSEDESEKNKKDEEIVDEEKNATPSDAIELDETENEVVAELATISEMKNKNLFGGNENEASESEIKLPPRFIDNDNVLLGNIDIDYVAPKVSNSGGLFGSDPTIPDRWDSREHSNAATGFNYVPPIRKQSPYGICWAFATIGMIETSIRKKGYVSDEDKANLSELALAYFVYDLKDVTNRTDYDNLAISGNDYHSINVSHYANPQKATWPQCGGNMINSTKMMSAYLGAVVEDATTEFSNDGVKTQAMIDAEDHGLPYEYAFKKNAYVTNNIYYINRDDRDTIKKAIMENGSVGFAYYSEPGTTDSEGYWIDSPALHWEDGKSYFHSQDRVDEYGRPETNHAVMIIGWDDNIDAKKFYYGGAPAEGKPDYTIMQYVYTKPPIEEEYNNATYKSTSNGGWLVRNSWGDDRPDLADGYFYIPYDEPSLSLTFYSIDAIKADTYKYNYHLDTTGATNSYPYSDTAYQFGNIFKVSGEDSTQVLDAVNIGLNSTNCEFDIKVYTKNDGTPMASPIDGTLATTKRGSNELAGFYTFELDDDVILQKDSYFSIVVEPVSTSIVKLFFDYTDESTGGYYFTHNEAKLGQSFYKRGTQAWRDINSDTYAIYTTKEIDGKLYGNNWRIKALTNPYNAAPAPTEGYYVLSKDWFDGSTPGIQKNEVESITILKYNEAVPTGADVTEWDLPSSSNGLKGYTKGKDIYIFAPADVPIKLPADSSFLFSGNMIKVNYTDNEHLTVREKSIEVPSPADGTTYPAYEALKNINGLNKLNTEDVTDMQGMFLGCRKLEAIDLSTFNTSNVLDMSLMFANCFNNIDCLDLSSFNTSKVTSFNQMFNGIGAKEVKVSSFDTSSALSMAGMFLSFQNPIYPGIEKLDISNFNTSNVRTMLHMISAYNLASVSVASFDTRNVTSFEGMFYEMPKLTELDISSFDTTSATDMRWMFNTCTNLKTIKAGTSFVAKGITENMFDGCTSLVGGKGTSYKDENPKDGTYARIDKGPTSSEPGYFTDKDSVPVIVNVTVTFDYDGKGTNFSKTYKNGETITRPTNPTYDGYTFVHWYKEGTSDTTAFDFTTPISEDSSTTIKLIAKWTAKTYTINYNAGTGATVSPTTFTKTYGTAITTDLAVPTKTGWTFAGWYTTDTLTTAYDKTKDDIYVEGQTTPYYIYAKWTAKTYTINYDANGGTITGSTSFEKKYGTAYSGTLTTPTKVGYTFGGWYTDNNTFSNSYDKSTDDIYVEGKTTPYYIYAKWTPKTYTINYIAGIGATVSPTSFTKTYGTAITADLAVPTKTGYTFINWYKESTFTNVYDKSNDDIYVEGQTTPYNIYAKFNANEYTVDYDLVGIGATKPSTITKTYDSPLASGVLKAPTNIPAGYEFLGWFRSYDSSTGTYGTEWTGSDDLTSGTTTQTIYAKWKRAIVYNVLMNGVDIGATAVPSKEITGETTYNLPSTSATGYTFGGWYGEAGCTTFKGNAGDPITVSAPTTLYAKWTPVQYKIYYKNIDGSSITDGDYITKTYGSNVTLNTTPTKTGYVFDGWFQNYNASTKTWTNPYNGTTDLASTQGDDKNIYAKWNPNQYQVNYNLSGVAATAPTTPITKAYGIALTAGTLKNPTNIPTGYTFAGWYKESTFANEWTGADDLTTGTTAQTIYARWKAKITYNANGHGTAPAAVDVYLNDTTVLPSITNVTGYIFDTTNSWYDDADVSTATLVGAAGANYTVTAPKTLYARWNEEEYTITYDRKDGNWTGTAPTGTRKYSQEITLPAAADISKNDGTNDYVFKGWYTVDGSTSTWDETKKVTKINANTVAPTGGHKFYARWNPAWKITFNMLSHGTKPSDIVAEQGTKVPTSEVPANPTETGYIFSGWYKNYDASAATFDGKYTNPFNFSTDTVTANMTLYAKWKPITYTISYNANGGTVSPTSDTKTYDSNLTLAVPTRTGYDFDGWYQNYDATTKTFTNKYDGTTNISTTQGDTKVVYAKWIAHQYTVDYNLGTEATSAGAMPPASTITKTYGENLTAGTLKNPSVIPSGYEFLGWYKEATFTNQWTGNDDLTSDSGVTVYIYAKWKRAIVFNVLYNGNNIGATVPASIEITSATTINLPSTTATGYTFGGWYREPELTNLAGNVGDPVNVSVPTTFYAMWSPISYSITYNALGGTLPSGTTNPFTKTYGTSATLVNPTYEGYEFAGWYANYNSATKAYSNPFNGTTDISTDTTGKTIYAKWNPHKYNINYELGGHATAMTATEKTYGVPYTPPTPTGVAVGYKFDGWFKESTYTNAYTGDDLTTGTDPQTIYARWKATVTYDVNGHGTLSPTTVDVILGNTTILPTLTNVVGYTFDTTNSWYDGSAVSTATLVGAAGSPYTVNAPKKLYARWNENEHSISYEKDGGDWVSAYDPVAAGVTSRKYSEERILPVALNIAKTGYTFLGWYKQGDTSKTVISKINKNIDEDITVVAKWSENTYSITLNRNGGNYVAGYTAPTTRKYTESKELPTNDNIKKTGHRLEGWHEQENYSDAAVTSIAVNTAEHKTFYAKWVPETYNVTLNTNGGTINSGNVTSYTYGSGETLPTDVTKANSVFKGWWTQDGTGNNWGTQVTAISATDTGVKTYYARWAESFVVTFNLTTGTAPAAANITNKPENQNIESGNRAARPTLNPQAANYEFVGWYDSTLTTEFNFNTAITAATTIYAKWNSVATHEVTFNLLSGTIHPTALTDITNVPETQYIVNGRKVTKPTDPTSTGYKFVGWYTDNTFATAWNFTSAVVTAPKTIYAKWELQKYNITYVRYDGVWASTFTPTTERTFGTAVTLPTSADISKSGYTFDGWFENSDFTGPITSIAGDFADHKTVYASWTRLATTKIITFNDNYSGATAEQAFTVGDNTAIKTNVFTRSGYTFIRWKDISGNVYINTSQLDGDIVLYAEWQKNPTPVAPSSPGNSSDGYNSGSGRTTIPISQVSQQPIQPSVGNQVPQVTVSTKKSDQVVVNGSTAKWQYDPKNNSWKLSALDLGGVPRNANNGFFIISQVKVVSVNNNLVQQVVNDTYYFDNKGNMVTGWIKSSDSKWYFFETEKTLDEGKLTIGWKKISGSWYFFNSNDGSMLANTVTPDGYRLGIDGRWVY